ncbi:MAG TPA: AAA family ATPase [Arthrobacter sp.]|nr:AAA family ATPase [Arthrobacter sp.]
MRKGQLTLITAAPGTGKSAVIQAMLQRGDDQGQLNKVLYHSADTDESTMWVRAAAIATGYETSDIERDVRLGTVSGYEAEVRAAAAHMEFSYDTSPSGEDIHREFEAYATKHGIYPEVFVMDNLANLYAGEGDEFAALQGNCDFLHGLCRDTKAAIITLHHTTGEYTNGDRPIPRSGIRGKIDKTPETIITMHRRGEQTFLCPVKNRTGKADPRAEWHLPLYSDLARMHFQG